MTAYESTQGCPACTRTQFITDAVNGEIFCKHCGFVVSDKIEETRAEWRSFSEGETNRARTGAGTTPPTSAAR